MNGTGADEPDRNGDHGGGRPRAGHPLLGFFGQIWTGFLDLPAGLKLLGGLALAVLAAIVWMHADREALWALFGILMIIVLAASICAIISTVALAKNGAEDPEFEKLRPFVGGFVTLLLAGEKATTDRTNPDRGGKVAEATRLNGPETLGELGRLRKFVAHR